MPNSLATAIGLYRSIIGRLSMRAKIAMTAALITSLNVSTMVLYSAQNQFLVAQQNGYLVADAAASDAAALITMRLSLAMSVAQNNAHAILALHNRGQATRERVNAILRQGLESHPELVGMYTGWEPNAFDGQDAKYSNNQAMGSNQDGRYMPYFEWSHGRVSVSPIMGYDQYGPGDFYLLPRDSGRNELIDPYPYPVGGKIIMMTSLVQPLMRQGQFVGISGVDIDLGTLQSELKKIEPMGSGSVYLYSSSRRVVSAAHLDDIGKKVSETEISPRMWFSVTNGSQTQYVDASAIHHFLIPVKMLAFDKPWVLDVRIPQSAILSQATQARRGAIAIGLLFLLLDVVLIGWVVLRQLRPLHDLKVAMEVAGGDLSGSADRLLLPVHRNDEIGMLARSFTSLRARLADSFATLEDRVKERTESLEQALHSLERAHEELRCAKDQMVQSEKMASLGALVAGVSHELNTPLGNAVTVVSVLQDEQKQFAKKLESGVTRTTLTAFVENVKEAGDLLRRNLERANDLVHSFKQIAVDQSSFNRRTFDLKEVIHEIVLTMSPAIKRTPFSISIDAPDRLSMNSFPGPVGQALMNLINNALLHGLMGREIGTVSISAHIDTPGWIMLCVADDGHGIPEDVKHKIFEPFFTTRLGQGGSGLGLNIVFNVVTGLLGGTIAVESILGQGAKFTLRLPMNAPAKEEDQK